MGNVDILIFTVFVISLFFIVKTTSADKEADSKSVDDKVEASDISEYEVIELISEREFVKHLKKMHSGKLSIEKGDFQKAKKDFEDAMDIVENGVDFRIRKLSPPSICYLDYSKFLHSIGEYDKSKKVLMRYVDLCRACGDVTIKIEDLDKQIKN